MNDDEIVQIYSAADAGQAHFLSNMLADAGIESRVVGEVASNLGIPAGEEAAPCVWVHHRDEEAARQILVQWEQTHAKSHPETEPKADWKCPSCGEMVDEDFDLCWNCQNPRKPY